jgi:plasmid stability protein
MPSIQIKNVPDEVHKALQAGARDSGKSLQEFLQAELRRIADRQSVQQVFDRARTEGANFTFDDVIEAIHSGRTGH